MDTSAPRPIQVVSVAITPKTVADRDRLRAGLETLIKEDPTVGAQTDLRTGQTTIAAMGETHLEVIIERLACEHGVVALVGKPEVIYRIGHRPSSSSKRASRQATRVLLEPVMLIDVIAPKEHVKDVMASLSPRRAAIQPAEQRGATMLVRARVRVADMFGYASDLRERTQGRATFSQRFDHYEPVPDDGIDGDRLSYVAWPLGPKLPLGTSSIALPEPDEE